MTMVPGASPPSNVTVSRGIGEATGCNCESSALAKTGAVPALRKSPAQTAARIRWRRMVFPHEDNRQSSMNARRAAVLRLDSARSHNYCGRERRLAMDCGGRSVTNSSIGLDCGKQDTFILARPVKSSGFRGDINSCRHSFAKIRSSWYRGPSRRMNLGHGLESQRRETNGKKNFCLGGQYNLLKRLNSAKRIQGNPSLFSLIFFDRLCRALLDLGIFGFGLDARKRRASMLRRQCGESHFSLQCGHFTRYWVNDVR